MLDSIPKLKKERTTDSLASKSCAVEFVTQMMKILFTAKTVITLILGYVLHKRNSKIAAKKGGNPVNAFPK